MKILTLLIIYCGFFIQCTSTFKPFHSNVPSKRIINGRYYSPKKDLSIDISYLIQTGIFIEERNLGRTLKLLIDDTSGIKYCVDQYDYDYIKSEWKWTFDSLIYYANATLEIIDTQFVNSSYGEEYRFITVEFNKGYVYRLDKTPYFNINTNYHKVNSRSIFIHSKYFYDITSSVVFNDSANLKTTIDRAKLNLSIFISKMKFK